MSAFIDQERERFAVELICRTLGVSTSAYYQRAGGERCARDVEDDRLVAVIRKVHADNYEAYGQRRMWKALLREGEDVGRDHVRRLMKTNQIVGAKRRGKPWRTTVPDPDAQRAPDLLERDFTASRPNEKWVADFTYGRCWEGTVFFSFVLDVYSHRRHEDYVERPYRPLPGYRRFANGRDALDALLVAPAGMAMTPFGDLLIAEPSLQAVRLMASDDSSQLAVALRSGRTVDGRLVLNYRTTGRAVVRVEIIQDHRVVWGQTARANPGHNVLRPSRRVPSGDFQVVLRARGANDQIATDCTRHPRAH